MSYLNQIFEQVLQLERLREMGENSSKITAINYVSIAERKRNNGEDIWTDNSINESVTDTLLRGRGTDKRFILKYTEEEQKSPENWCDNVKKYIQQKMKDIAPNLNIFENIKQKFLQHLKRK